MEPCPRANALLAGWDNASARDVQGDSAASNFHAHHMAEIKSMSARVE
jgi:hypothetical protein